MLQSSHTPSIQQRHVCFFIFLRPKPSINPIIHSTGSVKASPMEWGETLEMEAARSGSFLQQGQTDLEADEWQR